MLSDNLTIIISKDIKQNNQKNYNANLTTLPNDLNVLERNFERLFLTLWTTLTNAFNGFSNASNGKANFSNGFTNGLDAFPCCFNA